MELTKMRLINRIYTLQRRAGKDNSNIIRKLNRKLRKLK